MDEAASPIVLIVGADPKRLQWMSHHLTSQWPEAVVSSLPASEGASLAAALSTPPPDAIALYVDFAAPAFAEAALESMLHVLRVRPAAYFIVLARAGDELAAVRCMKLGAREYLPLRSLSREMLLGAMASALGNRTVQERGAAIRVALEESPAPPGLELPGYEIVKLIASSHVSSVYLARRARGGKTVVAKVLSRGTSTRELQDAERFEREHEIISSISHRAIVEIYDFGALPRHLYLTMEYFPCGDLRDRLRNPLTVEESRYYLHSIAEALRVIHVFGIFHRDLKPGNVMLREDNSPVLIDFGLARRIDDSSATTGIGKVMGSPYYMSPEQAQGHAIDARTDLYSLGIMYHEMLTGTRPYLGRSAMSIMTQHVKSPVPKLPEHLRAQQSILDRLMAKELARRYASTDELLADLADETVAS